MSSERKIKILDNFLAKEDADNIERECKHPFFPWYYASSINPEYDHLQEKPNHQFQFVHSFYFEHKVMSNAWPILEPLIKKIKIKSLIRVKANLYPGFDKKVIHPKHVDYTYNTNGAIYYVNTNNGTTNLTNKKIKSVKNRLLYFNASKPHNSTTCTDKKIRLNININYL